MPKHRKNILHHQSTHHRKPRSLKGKSDARNISHVSENKHRAWHLLFANHTPVEIAKIINDVWLDPDFKFIAKPIRCDHCKSSLEHSYSIHQGKGYCSQLCIDISVRQTHTLNEVKVLCNR